MVNVPIGALLCAGMLYAVTESRRDDAERRVDVLGSLSITISLVALVYAVVQAQKLGWSDPRILTTLGVSVVLLVLFIIDEGKLAKQPLVPLTIFRSRSVSAANIVAFTSTAALWGTFYLFTLLLQLVLGYSPLQTGLAYLPLSLGILVAARGIAPLVPKIGPRPMLISGLLLSAVGLAWLSHASVDAGFWSDLFSPSLVLGIGQGMISASVTIAGTAEVSYREQGLVSGLLNTSRQVGGAVGLAILAAIATAQTGTQVSKYAFAAGYDKALFVSALFPILGVLAAMAVPQARKDKSELQAPARA